MMTHWMILTTHWMTWITKIEYYKLYKLKKLKLTEVLAMPGPLLNLTKHCQLLSYII